MTEAQTEWSCDDCGHTEYDHDEDGPVGETVTKSLRCGGRTKTVETTICPKCGSTGWHSEGLQPPEIAAAAVN